jgi:sulfoxide reductase heme-binding subunit YedZ
MGSDDPVLHLSRAAGLGAYLMLWLDMCLGVALGGTLAARSVPRWRLADLHQFTASLGLGLLLLHIGTLVGLRVEPFTPAELFVPFVRQVNPVAPVLGIAGFYVLLLVTGISHARRQVGVRIWRSVHRLSFVGFALCVAHAVVAGPDLANAWTAVIYAATLSVLGILVLLRVRMGLRGRRKKAEYRQPLGWAVLRSKVRQ